MGRKRKLTPTYSEHRGQMRARWTSDAGRHEVPLGPSDRPDVWQPAFAKLLKQLADDPESVVRPLTEYLLSELCSDFLVSDDCLPQVKPRVWQAVAHLTACHPKTPVSEFGPRAFEDWRDWLCGHKGTDGLPRYTTTTVTKYMGYVRRMFAWGVRRERVEVVAWQALLTVPGPRVGQARAPKVVAPVEDAAVDAVLPFLRKPVRAMVELQRLTGARPSELFRMTPGAVYQSGRPAIPGLGSVDLDTLGVWLYVPGKAKVKGRLLALGPKAQSVLAPFLERDPLLPCFSPAESLEERLASVRGTRKTKLYTPKKKGKPKSKPGTAYKKGSYRQAVHRACDKAGIERFNPYQMRHLHLTAVDAEMGLDAAQHAGGHNSPQTTRRYAKVSFTTAARVAREMG